MLYYIQLSSLTNSTTNVPYCIKHQYIPASRSGQVHAQTIKVHIIKRCEVRCRVAHILKLGTELSADAALLLMTHYSHIRQLL